MSCVVGKRFAQLLRLSGRFSTLDWWSRGYADLIGLFGKLGLLEGRRSWDGVVDGVCMWVALRWRWVHLEGCACELGFASG